MNFHSFAGVYPVACMQVAARCGRHDRRKNGDACISCRRQLPYELRHALLRMLNRACDDAYYFID
jgi:hypothetical protein